MRPLVCGSRETSAPGTAKRVEDGGGVFRRRDAGRAGRHAQRSRGYSPRAVRDSSSPTRRGRSPGWVRPPHGPPPPRTRTRAAPASTCAWTAESRKYSAFALSRFCSRKRRNPPSQRGHQRRGEAPEVERHGRRARDRLPRARLVEAPRVLAVALDLQHLADRDEEAALVDRADAAAHGAVRAERGGDREADDRELGHDVHLRLPQEVGQHPVAARAVEVVGVDDGEGAVQERCGGEGGVAGAPRLGAARGRGEARGKGAALDRVGHRDVARDPVAHRLADLRLHALAHDQHDAVEAGAPRVEGGVVEEGRPAGAHAVDLLGAAVPASHPGGEDDEAQAHPGGMLLRLAPGRVEVRMAGP